MSKDTKILIPEIPGEWTQRTRNGHENIWNDPWHKTGQPEVKMYPPAKGLYAERIGGAWYWVNGCEKCNGNHQKHSYITCYEHDRCEMCGIHRTEITETPWGTISGWVCVPCDTAHAAKRKAEALQAAKEAGHSESDCRWQDSIICPYCASDIDSEGHHEDEDGIDCGVCGGTFNLEVVYEPSYTTKGATPPTMDDLAEVTP